MNTDTTEPKTLAAATLAVLWLPIRAAQESERRLLARTMIFVPVFVAYEVFAIPLVLGSVIIVLALTAPLIAAGLVLRTIMAASAASPDPSSPSTATAPGHPGRS